MFNNSGYSLADIAAATGNSGRNSNDTFGDGGWWIILLFLFAGLGWGGNGSGFGGGNTTREEIAYGFDMNGLDNNVRGIQQGLCDGFYSLNTGMLNGFTGVQNALCQGFNGVNTSILTSGYQTLDAIHADTIANMQNTNAITAGLTGLSTQIAATSSDIARSVDKGFCDLGYALATQEGQTRQAVADATRDIIEGQNAGTRAILDFLTQDKIAALTAENQTLRFAASQQAQNAYLVSELGTKCPVPAYVVPNPNCCYPQAPYFGTCGYGY